MDYIYYNLWIPPTICDITTSGRYNQDIKEACDGEVCLMIFHKMGKQWIQRFLVYHSELSGIHPQSIDAAWLKDQSFE